MKPKWFAGGLFCLFPAVALHAVPTADVVTLSDREGQYEVRLAGVDAPDQGPLAECARPFFAGMVLNKNARMRFEYRDRNGNRSW